MLIRKISLRRGPVAPFPFPKSGRPLRIGRSFWDRLLYQELNQPSNYQKKSRELQSNIIQALHIPKKRVRAFQGKLRGAESKFSPLSLFGRGAPFLFPKWR
jgi:hypothetical protein